MRDEVVTASITMEAPAASVFAVLADPSVHSDIDGTGWVRGAVNNELLTAVGQVFRVAMFHEDHPDKDYEIANRVVVFDEPHEIAWKPGTESAETGEIGFGGWIWHYDIEDTGPSRSIVTLKYDWTAVPPEIREYLDFPMFDRDHLGNSLRNLERLVDEQVCLPVQVTIPGNGGRSLGDSSAETI